MTVDLKHTAHNALPEPTRTEPEQAAASMLRHSLLHSLRLIRAWPRDPATMIQALVYPALTLVMLRIVLGDSVTAATGQPSIYGTVPMVTLIGAMSGAIVSGLGLRKERDSGLLARFWTMPVNRAAGLVGRLSAEAIRVLTTTAIILAVGVALGFRFNQGLLAGIALLFVPVVFGIGFAVMVTALVTVPGELPLVEIVGILTTLLMFFNSGFVPVNAYPTWLQDIVANQPMSCAIDAMKGLSLGGPVAEPLIKTLIWSGGLVAVFIVPTIRGYRRAAEAGS